MLAPSLENFDALKKSVFQSLFITGIPFFAYVNFIDSIKFDIVPFFISSFLCIFSVSNMNVFFERKNLFYLVLSMVFFISGLLFTHIFSGSNFVLSLFYIFVYFNWGAYYIIRKIVIFPDILLHTTGGILIFSLGLIWGIHEKGMEKLFGSLFDNEKVLLSLFASLAFTAGYLIDLIDDMEEDRKAGQKNLAEKIGVKLTFLLSSFLFLISYMNGFFVMKQNISKIIFTLLFLTHLLTAAILFFKDRILKFVPKYRNFYRILFIIYCIIITFDNRKFHSFFS
jgi:4-hydroxybenzoate polyprenyltransferase